MEAQSLFSIISSLGLLASIFYISFLKKKNRDTQLKLRLSELMLDGNSGGIEFIRLIEKSPPSIINELSQKIKNNYRILMTQNNVIWLDNLIIMIGRIDESNLRIKMFSLLESAIISTPLDRLADFYAHSIELSASGSSTKKSADLILKTVLERKREDVEKSWEKLSQKLDELLKNNHGNEYLEMIVTNEKMKVKKIIEII